MAAEFQSSGQLIGVDDFIYSQAVEKFFKDKASKKDILFDYIVAAAAEEYKTEAVFSFDKFYKKHNFKLASEL